MEETIATVLGIVLAAILEGLFQIPPPVTRLSFAFGTLALFAYAFSEQLRYDVLPPTGMFCIALGAGLWIVREREQRRERAPGYRRGILKIALPWALGIVGWVVTTLVFPYILPPTKTILHPIPTPTLSPAPTPTLTPTPDPCSPSMIPLTVGAVLNPMNAGQIRLREAVALSSLALDAALSDDGKTLILATEHEVCVYDTRTICRLQDLKETECYPFLVAATDVALSPDGQYIASATVNGQVHLLLAHSGQLVHTLGTVGVQATSVAFDPVVSTQFASANDLGQVCLWNVSGQELWRFSGHSSEVLQLNFTPDGQLLASAGRDNAVRVWNIYSRSLEATLQGHSDDVHTLAFNWDERLLASGGDDGTIRFWQQPEQPELDKWSQIRVLHNRVSVLSIDFSPDGQLLASGGIDGVIRVWNAQTGEQLVALRGHEGIISRVVFILGGRILVSAGSDNTVRLWGVPTSESVNTAVDTSMPASTPATQAQPAHPPESLPAPSPFLIAFDSQRDGHWEVYLMDENGLSVVDLTNHPANDGDPTWSPDGKRIAFDSDRDGNWEIYAMNRDGSGITRLTNHRADDDSPAWSPDGSRIAFKSNRDGNWEIYVVNLDNLGVTNLTNHPGTDQMPAWSPDNRRIAFVSYRTGDLDIWVMNADGSDLDNLTRHPAKDSFPAWSPDGQRIAFHSYRGGNAEIYVMNADGSGLARLTNHPAEDWGPSWSPDGLRLAFTSDRDGDDEIYVIDTDGQNVVQITYNGASDTWPAWSPMP